MLRVRRELGRQGPGRGEQGGERERLLWLLLKEVTPEGTEHDLGLREREL